MNQLVQAKLKTIDTTKGFNLAGDQVVLQLDLPDSVAKKRLATSRNPNDREPMLPGN
jgi:hypothetical protein